MTTQARRLAVGRSRNLRDVGGYPLKGGRETRWGVLYRSEAWASAEADREAVKALRLRTVIDLRDAGESDTLHTGLRNFVPATRTIPLDPRPLLDDVSLASPDPLGDLYIALIRNRGTQIAAVVSELGAPGALPALVHCTAGKDRTGTVVALVLSALGVDDDTVTNDFALTMDYLTPDFFTSLPKEAGAADPSLRALLDAEPRSMKRMLDFVRDAYGSAELYLRHHGVECVELERIRSALV